MSAFPPSPRSAAPHRRGLAALALPPALIVLAFLAAPQAGAAQDHEHVRPESADEVPLYDDLGDHAYQVTVRVPEAQAYFNQGLRLYYAFNHQEGIRAFRAAQELDPTCAMCWWGEAMAWGPNINLPMDRAAALEAYRSVQEALDRLEYASPKEQDMIRALSVRYAADPPEDRSVLDQAYADAMGDLAARYPEDPEIRVLHAEALMDLSPWDYWADGETPRPWIAVALDGLEYAQSLNPDHPGACHFYIHAVEEVDPERAVPCAERLARLMPGAGHLVHMPGHIYIRVGRYGDAIEANQHAIHADETYIQDQRPGMGMYTAGYYPHNYDFLAFAAMMIGRSRTSLEAADRITDLLPEAMFGTPGMDFLQHWSTRPLLMRVRFGRWDEILAEPAPPADRAHARAVWHYARGRALAATGDTDGAREQLEQLRGILRSGALEGMRMEFNPSPKLVAISERVLTGRIASAEERHDAALAALAEAVELEDALDYGEPPEWSVPTRQDLGEAALAAGRPALAEEAFRGDLERFPLNGWSLAGLRAALVAQGKSQAARQTEAQFREAWRTADTELPEILRR